MKDLEAMAELMRTEMPCEPDGYYRLGVTQEQLDSFSLPKSSFTSTGVYYSGIKLEVI